MPMVVRVDHERRCVIVRSEAPDLDDAVLRELVAYLEGRVPEAASYAALYDFRSVEQVGGLSTECVRELAGSQSCGSERNPDGKPIAILASADVLFGIGRMFQTLSEGRIPGVRVFREIAPAREHVGLAGAGDGDEAPPREGGPG